MCVGGLRVIPGEWKVKLESFDKVFVSLTSVPMWRSQQQSCELYITALTQCCHQPCWLGGGLVFETFEFSRCDGGMWEPLVGALDLLAARFCFTSDVRNRSCCTGVPIHLLLESSCLRRRWRICYANIFWNILEARSEIYDLEETQRRKRKYSVVWFLPIFS